MRESCLFAHSKYLHSFSRWSILRDPERYVGFQAIRAERDATLDRCGRRKEARPAGDPAAICGIPIPRSMKKPLTILSRPGVPDPDLQSLQVPSSDGVEHGSPDLPDPGKRISATMRRSAQHSPGRELVRLPDPEGRLPRRPGLRPEDAKAHLVEALHGIFGYSRREYSREPRLFANRPRGSTGVAGLRRDREDPHAVTAEALARTTSPIRTVATARPASDPSGSRKGEQARWKSDPRDSARAARFVEGVRFRACRRKIWRQPCAWRGAVMSWFFDSGEGSGRARIPSAV